MVSTENENNFKKALEQGINLFLGPSFSILANDTKGDLLPTSRQLAEELIIKFSVPLTADADLSQICAVIEFSRKNELRDYLKSRFSVTKYDNRYDILDMISVNSILTTNIDDLLYKIYSISRKSYINDVDKLGPSYRDRKAIDLITLYGSVLDDNRPYRFGSAAIMMALATNQDRWGVVNGHLQRLPTLFWGFNRDDILILQTLNTNTVVGRRHKDKWILTDPSEIDEGTRNLFKTLELQIVAADTPSMLDYLQGITPRSARTFISNVSLKTRDLFPQESIPELGTVPVRPVVDFYLGSPPQWSDIYSGNIHRTVHYNSLRDSINSGKHTVIFGVPGCGKTTLLMQVATDDFRGSHKLMCDSITVDKARLIQNRLQGSRALIFVDNFADSLDAFEYLSTRNNIQLVGADRDYHFGIINHRIDRSRFNIFDVTEIPGSDIQQCLQYIPSSIKTPRYMRPETSPGIEPSLFEIIEYNVSKPTLKERFASVLKNIAKADITLHDLLIVISYVYQCRVPVSMDMLIAYLRDVTIDYNEVYDLCNRLGSMITEYGGNLQIDTDQDYFLPRSTVLGEAVLDNVKGADLKRMLLCFNKNISPYRIHRYDTFRKYAYDHRIIAKAFPNVNEGKLFYEDLYRGCINKSYRYGPTASLSLNHCINGQNAITH